MKNALANNERTLERFAGGDTEAFTMVYRQFYFPVYRYAKRWLPEREDAEDVAADSFVKLWNRRENFTSLETIHAFLRITVRNACFDFLKHCQVKTAKQHELLRQLSINTLPDSEWQEICDEFMKLVYAEVAKMPGKMREIFLLSYKEGLKPSEIAQRLELSVQTVSNQKTNAIRLLKVVMANKPVMLALVLCFEAGQVFHY